MERYPEALRCYLQDQDVLSEFEYPKNLSKVLSGYSGIEVQGAGPQQDYGIPEKLLKVRMLSSHLINEDCLIFAFFGPHRKRFAAKLEEGKQYVFRNCTIVVEETCDLSWLAAIPMGLCVLENCEIYKVQDYMFRAFHKLPVKLEYAIPWAVGAGSRLVMFLVRMGLGNSIRAISSSQYCWQSQRYAMDRSKTVSAKENVLTIEWEGGEIQTHADYMMGNVFLRAFLEDLGLQPRYESHLNLFSISQLLQSLNQQAIVLPVRMELSGRGEVQYEGNPGTPPTHFRICKNGIAQGEVIKRSDSVILDQE